MYRTFQTAILTSADDWCNSAATVRFGGKLIDGSPVTMVQIGERSLLRCLIMLCCCYYSDYYCCCYYYYYYYHYYHYYFVIIIIIVIVVVCSSRYY